MTIRIILADDHQILRQALGRSLAVEGEIQLVGEAGDGIQVVTMTQQLQPDVLVVDIDMPLLSGIEATRQILAAGLETKVIILSRFSDQELVVRAMKEGAKGYLLKKASIDELLLAIKAVNEGYFFLSPGLLNPVVSGYLNWVDQEGASPLDVLTAREREVLHLVAEGKSNQTIANQLQLSVRTVESHRSNLMGKLNIHNVAELVRFAIQHKATSIDA